MSEAAQDVVEVWFEWNENTQSLFLSHFDLKSFVYHRISYFRLG